ncbi:MAG: hypothetical protein IRY99_12785 [Isosphaeraceae bacterium]|nr:hypothetical protein [Isosphaeraceae bacterium]
MKRLTRTMVLPAIIAMAGVFAGCYSSEVKLKEAPPVTAKLEPPPKDKIDPYNPPDKPGAVSSGSGAIPAPPKK